MSDLAVKRLLGLVVAVLVVAVGTGAVVGSRAVADGLRTSSVQLLDDRGLHGVEVDFTGREAVLRSSNVAVLGQARVALADEPGVRRVTVSPTRSPGRQGAARFALDRFGDDVRIDGVVPSADDAAAIKIAAARTFGTTVTGDVRVDRSLSGGGWTSRLPDVFDDVSEVEALEIDVVGDGTVRLAGTLGTASAVDQVVSDVAKALGDLEVDAAIDVASTSRKGR